MESDGKDLLVLNPPNTVNETTNLVPEKSKELYYRRYDLFMDWCRKNGSVQISEDVILVYLSQQSQVCSPNYLWTMYSMLKATIREKHNINIRKYKQLRAFLKNKNVGYQAQKSKTFTEEEVHNFLKNAPDEQYLLNKVALIFGICGACRTGELCNMTINDIEDKGSILIVNVPDSKSNKGRVFTVMSGKEGVDFLYYCRKYLNLRPKTADSPRLFLNYRNGRCFKQVVGKNKLGKIPMNIAQYLKLPNPKFFTGHALRRTSATLLVNAGGIVTQLKNTGWWKSRPNIAKGYKESIRDVTWKEKEEGDSVSSDSSAHVLNQDDSLSQPMPEQDSVHGPSTPGSENVDLKDERFKDELHIEDYGGDPSDIMEFQLREGVESVGKVEENMGVKLAKPSSSGAGGPFETIICGGDVQIKQEVFEDERDCFNSGMEVDTTPTGPALSTPGIAEPLSSVTAKPTTSLSNFSELPKTSSGTTTQVHPPPKKSNQHVDSNILHLQKQLKSVPAFSFEKCRICTEVFPNPSDLVEHCILKHSDASSKFIPTSYYSVPEQLKPTEILGLCTSTTSGFSAATTPGFSAATTPGFSAANPPGQPPQNCIPPHISACDVFDGVFVSLRNIPERNRPATREKILELVNFLLIGNVDPSRVRFIVEEK